MAFSAMGNQLSIFYRQSVTRRYKDLDEQRMLSYHNYLLNMVVLLSLYMINLNIACIE